MDTNEPGDRDDQRDQTGDSDRDDQPTTPLPWGQDGRDAQDGQPTTPLPWWQGAQEQPTTPLPWVDGPHSAVPPTPPAAGMAVTDGMKAGEPQPDPSFFRRHALGVGVAAAVLAVVVVAGGTAWGVSAAVAAGNTAVPAAVSAAAHAQQGTAAGSRMHAKGVVGSLTAISGDTWTVRSAAGATITVTVGSSTAFGTQQKPAGASSFVVGDRIAVLGARSGDTVTATRIVHLAAAKRARPGAGTAPAGTPTPAATA